MADPNRLRIKTPGNAHGKLYEPRAAKKLGARLTPNSGATVGSKGDMRTALWLIESKTTVNQSLAMELAWLVKITEEASTSMRNPALLFSFVLPDGRPRPNASTEWVAMPLHLFQELTDGPSSR